MRRTRALLLGVMAAFLALANLPQAKAALINPCIEQCATNDRICSKSCFGNATCLNDCASASLICEEGCET
jgi:hypothetical protein